MNMEVGVERYAPTKRKQEKHRIAGGGRWRAPGDWGVPWEGWRRERKTGKGKDKGRGVRQAAELSLSVLPETDLDPE